MVVYELYMPLTHESALRMTLDSLFYKDAILPRLRRIGIEVLGEFDAAGSKERRNRADVLAAGKDGKPAVVAGREFPVLRSAQISRNRPATANAIHRPEEHEAAEGTKVLRFENLTRDFTRKSRSSRKSRKLA